LEVVQMSYEAPELYEPGEVGELTLGGTGCSTDHETDYGEELGEVG
jgi:hypothetical protein